MNMKVSGQASTPKASAALEAADKIDGLDKGVGALAQDPVKLPEGSSKLLNEDLSQLEGRKQDAANAANAEDTTPGAAGHGAD